MRRWSRHHLWMWMLVVVAVAVTLGGYRVAVNRRAAEQAAARRFINLVDSAIAAQIEGERSYRGLGGRSGVVPMRPGREGDNKPVVVDDDPSK